MRKAGLWKTGIVVGGCGLLGFVGLNVLAYNHARSMLRFTEGGTVTERPEMLSRAEKAGVLISGISLPRPSGNGTPRDYGLDYEEGEIECADSIRLAYWHVPARGSSDLILMFHSYAGDKSTLLTEARVFHEMGYATLLVDFRGSGGSSESYTSIGYHEAEDVAEAVAFAGSELPYGEHVLFGQSMGAVAILRAVHAHGVRARGIILEAVFDEAVHTVQHRFEAMGVPSFPSAQLLLFWGGRELGFDAFSHNPISYAPSVRCPILFLHGTEDMRARIDEGRRVYDVVGAPKDFRVFEGLGHERYVNQDMARWREAVGWLLVSSQGKR